MNKKKNKVIAAFDFDGTISYSDTLLPFLFHVKGWSIIPYAIVLLPIFLLFYLKIIDRQTCKEKILTRFLYGMEKKTLDCLGHQFATTGLKKKIRPEALKRIHWHQKRGDTLVLISASCNVYLFHWGKQEGFDYVITSELEYDDSNRFTGHLSGLNCRGQEKTKRLLALFPDRASYTLYVYGDSDGDQDLLELSDYPFYRSLGK